MDLVHTSGRKKRLGAIFSLAIAAALACFALSAGATSAATTSSCPSFRVLHNDRIGPANLPAGNYEVTPTATSGLTCARASALFTRFLSDWDGNLPNPWRVIGQGPGKASFARGSRVAFTVVRSGGGEEEGGNPSIGQLCPGTYTVNHRTIVGPLAFNRGRYLIYIPARSGITCRRASVLFTRFLGQPGGRLPFPWHVINQTATFYRSANPTRSAFRLEPFAGT